MIDNATAQITGTTNISPLKLVNFKNNKAEYHKDGCAYEAIRYRNCWILTGSYIYLYYRS